MSIARGVVRARRAGVGGSGQNAGDVQAEQDTRRKFSKVVEVTDRIILILNAVPSKNEEMQRRK